MEIYLFRDDQQTGPYAEAEARALVASSQIARTCLAWHEGLSDWQPLEAVVALPKPPSSSTASLVQGLPPVPPRNRVQSQEAATAVTAPVVASSSTIHTVSGIIALLLGLLTVFNVGGCMNAHGKLASFQNGDNAMDGLDVLVGTARGMHEGDPLRGVAGLMDKARSLQDDYEGSRASAWLCLVSAAAAGGVFLMLGQRGKV